MLEYVILFILKEEFDKVIWFSRTYLLLVLNILVVLFISFTQPKLDISIQLKKIALIPLFDVCQLLNNFL